MKNVTPLRAMPEPPEIPLDAQRRLQRLRRVAWILDRSIPLGGNARIGIDPIIGLVPGIGDWIATLLSVYVLYQAARLGLPGRVLGRIAFNIAVEGIVGSVPIAGDLFDFVFQANMRNLRLVETNYHAQMRPRSFARIWLGLGLFALALMAFVTLAAVLMVKALLGLLSLFGIPLV